MKKKISVCYSCSDVIHHEHKTKIGAWLCGRWQVFLFSQLSRLTKRVPDKLACDDIYHDFLLQWEEVKYCDVCGTPIRR